MKHQSKMKLSLSICTSAMMIVITPLNLSSCSSTGIVLANFESYMAPKLMDQLHEKHSIRFVNYSTNEDILAKFANSYDIAVPSTYTVLELIKNDLIGGVNQEVQIDGTSHTIENVGIDWQYLGQKYQLTALPDRFGETALPLIDKATPKSESYDPKYDPSNAQSLFSETIDNVIDAVDAYAHEPAHRYYGNDKSILYYAIPYFLQDWMFAYHGDYIPELPSSTQHENGWYSDYSEDPTNPKPVTWNDITDVISPKKNAKNANLDNRFKPTNRQRMTLVDDSRTNYDMAHLIYDTQHKVADPGINPGNGQTTLSAIASVYAALTDKFNPNTFRLNSDSQQALYSFAKPIGDPEHATFAEANGIIAYNGDILYAAMGAGIDDWADTWYCEPESEDGPLIHGNFHIVKPKDTPVALDMMVINKKVNQSSKKQDVYDILYKILLEGCNETPDIEGIGLENDHDEFVYGPMLNFDYVAYTPTLYNLNTFVARDMDEPDPENSYFDMLYPDDHNKAELLAEINNVNFDINSGRLIELPLSNLAKSNMSTVYMQYKEKL